MLFLRRHFSYIVLLVFIFVALGVWGAVWAATPPGVVTVAIIEVGQGDSIFIESPTGTKVIVDGGPDDTILTELPKLMPLSERSLDAVIETYPNANRIGGLISLLKRYSVGVFIEPGVSKNTLTAQALEKEITDRHIPRATVGAGDWVDLGGGAELTFVAPQVLELTYGASSLTITPDIRKSFGEAGTIVLTSDGKDFVRK